MRLFKDNNNPAQVYGFNDKQVAKGMAAGMTEITKAEYDAIQEQKRLEAEASRPPVTVVSMRQARLALHGAGLLAQVNAAIEDLPEPDKTQAAIEWEYAGTVDRVGPITQTLAAQMGLTESDLDQLFTTAGTL